MKISLRRCLALIVEDGAFSFKRPHVTILNLKGHSNWFTGLIVLPISGASAVKGLQSAGLHRPVFLKSISIQSQQTQHG